MTQEPRRKGRPRGFHSKPEQSTIQALSRALTVLDVLAENTGMTLTEVATELEQSPATIHRVLTTLATHEMAEMNPRDQSWRVGPMAFRIGSAFLRGSDVIERSRPAMRMLEEQSGETSNLGIEVNGNVMFISQVETMETIRAFFPPGTVSPMHASGIGKALLSRYSKDRIDRWLRDQTLERFTDNTVWSPEMLKSDLALARRRGWAFDDEEKTPGMRCVAAPILNIHGEAVAGISVSGPTHRLPEQRIKEIGKLVRNAAEDVSHGLGAPAVR